MDKYFVSLIPIYICFIIFLGVLMFRRRYAAIKFGKIDAGYFKSYQGNVPYDLKIIQNNFESQFQIPLLFFLTVISTIQFDSVSLISVLLGYAFLFSRFLHSYIHLGKNNLRKRALSYLVGILIILALWILIFLN